MVRVEDRPAGASKALDARDVGVQPGGLGNVNARKLTLPAGDGHGLCVPESRAEFLELPDARRNPLVKRLLTSAAEVFRMLQQAPDSEASLAS